MGLMDIGCTVHNHLAAVLSVNSEAVNPNITDNLNMARDPLE